jgi:hypothetical protein
MIRPVIILIQLFVNSEISVFFKSCTIALAKSRGKGVYLTLIVFALHVVLAFLYWVGDLHVALNLLLSGAFYEST